MFYGLPRNRTHASFGVKDLPLVGVRLLVGLVELGG